MISSENCLISSRYKYADSKQIGRGLHSVVTGVWHTMKLTYTSFGVNSLYPFVLFSSEICIVIGCLFCLSFRDIVLVEYNHVVTWAFETIIEQLCAIYRRVNHGALEVINPDGGTEDAEAEAMSGDENRR